MCASHTENASPAPPLSSKFLSLPRELRDMIYDYALTSQWGLISRADKITGKVVEFSDKSVGASAPEFNQIQYVNKQLRKETRGLAMKHNTLFIIGLSLSTVSQCSIEGTEMAANFLEECSPRVKASLCELQISNAHCEAPRSTELTAEIPRNHPAQMSILVHDNAALSIFCQKYPSVQVVLCCGLFTDEWLMFFGVMYQYHVTFGGQRSPKSPHRSLGHDLFYGNYENVSDAEALALHLPMTALPHNLQIAVEDEVYDDASNTWMHVMHKRKAGDILEAARDLFEVAM